MGVVERSIRISGSSLGTGLEAIWGAMEGEALTETLPAGERVNGATEEGREADTGRETEELAQGRQGTGSHKHRSL